MSEVMEKRHCMQTDHVLIVSTHCHRRRVMSAAPDTRQSCYTIQNTGLGLQSRHTSYNKECLNLKIGDVRVWSFLHIASVCSGGFKCIYFFCVWLKAECAQTYGEARAGPVVPRLAPVERSGVQHCYQLVTNGQRQPNC